MRETWHPLFTTNVTDPTTTPALSFDLSDASPYTLFGNNTNANAAPAFFAPVLASSLFANQGTATTVLHGNASGNLSWGAVNLGADVSGILPVANGGTGAAALTEGSVVFAGPGGVYSENNTNFFWDDTNAKLNLGDPAGTAGALNIGPDGIYSYRDANRHIRFNANGLVNDFESKGAKLVINFGIFETPEDVSIFEGTSYSGTHEGHFMIGTPDTSARMVVQGSTADNTGYAFKVTNATPADLFSVRNDGAVVISSIISGGKSLSISNNGIEKLFVRDSGAVNISAVLTTDNALTITGSGPTVIFARADNSSSDLMQLWSGAYQNFTVDGAGRINMRGDTISLISSVDTIIKTTNNTALNLGTNNTDRYSISNSGNHDFKSGTARFGNTVSIINNDLKFDSATGFGILSQNNNRQISITNVGVSIPALTGGTATFWDWIKTAAPTGSTAQPWKLGDIETVSGSIDPSNAIAVEINGTTYYIAIYS